MMKCPISAKFTCMCGDEITHSAWECGHSPVSQWNYFECTEVDVDDPYYEEHKKLLEERFPEYA